MIPFNPLLGAMLIEEMMRANRSIEPPRVGPRIPRIPREVTRAIDWRESPRPLTKRQKRRLRGKGAE